MTIHADWRSWTYFFVNGELIAGGRIVDYNLQKQRLRYLRSTGKKASENPYEFGTPEHERWLWERAEGTYDHAWVDPSKSIALSPNDVEALENGRKPDSFVELIDQDPQDFFHGQERTVSTCVPSHEEIE